MLHVIAHDLNHTHPSSLDVRPLDPRPGATRANSKAKNKGALDAIIIKKKAVGQETIKHCVTKVGLATAKLFKRPMANTAALKAQKMALLDADDFLNTVGAGRSLAQYNSGEAVFLQGDSADAVFYIQKGKVQITVVSKHGKEGVVAMLSPGEFFGEGCLAGQKLHIATATVMVESIIVKIDKQAMVREMSEKPSFSQMFMTFLLSRNIQVEADLIDHLFNSSEKRLARILLLLANIGTEGRVETVPRINQETLAARVGTTRSRINFFMNKFRDLGFIEYTTGAVKVHSSLLSVIVHD